MGEEPLGKSSKRLPMSQQIGFLKMCLCAGRGVLYICCASKYVDSVACIWMCPCLLPSDTVPYSAITWGRPPGPQVFRNSVSASLRSSEFTDSLYLTSWGWSSRLKQILYLLSHIPSLHCFYARSQCSGWTWTPRVSKPSTSDSWVARTTGAYLQAQLSEVTQK